MLRWVSALLILCIITAGCLTAPTEKNVQATQQTGNVTISPPKEGSGEVTPGVITTKGNVTLSIERPVYGVGDEVHGRFVFSGNLSVFPYMRILRLENGTWTELGLFYFNGGEYVCCGVFLPCENIRASESSPILLSWNQELSRAEWPITSPINVTTQPAGPGEYRLVVDYGTSSCMEGDIEAGFTIR